MLHNEVTVEMNLSSDKHIFVYDFFKISLILEIVLLTISVTRL